VDSEVLAKDTIDRRAVTVFPVELLAIKIGGIESADDMIALRNILDTLTDLNDNASGIRARNDIILGGEGIKGEGNTHVAIVQRDRVNLDQNLIFLGLRDRLFESLEVLERVTLTGETNDGLLRHDCGRA